MREAPRHLLLAEQVADDVADGGGQTARAKDRRVMDHLLADDGRLWRAAKELGEEALENGPERGHATITCLLVPPARVSNHVRRSIGDDLDADEAHERFNVRNKFGRLGDSDNAVDRAVLDRDPSGAVVRRHAVRASIARAYLPRVGRTPERVTRDIVVK